MTVQRTPGGLHVHTPEQAPVIPAVLNGVGVVAVVLLIGLGLATGRLYTRSQVNEMKRGHEREIERLNRDHERETENISHDRDEWRTEGRVKDQHIGEITDQNTTLLREIAPTMNSLLGGLRTAASKARGDDT